MAKLRTETLTALTALSTHMATIIYFPLYEHKAFQEFSVLRTFKDEDYIDLSSVWGHKGDGARHLFSVMLGSFFLLCLLIFKYLFSFLHLYFSSRHETNFVSFSLELYVLFIIP